MLSFVQLEVAIVMPCFSPPSSPRIARLIVGGEKYFKQYDFLYKVLLVLLLLVCNI